jgi:hypothetical protein
MPLALLDEDRDLPAKFLVALREDARLGVQPRVAAAADVQQRHASFRQDAEAVERLGLGHVAAQDRVLGVDARHLVRVLDRPGVGLAGRAAGPFQHRRLR